MLYVIIIIIVYTMIQLWFSQRITQCEGYSKLYNLIGKSKSFHYDKSTDKKLGTFIGRQLSATSRINYYYRAM